MKPRRRPDRLVAQRMADARLLTRADRAIETATLTAMTAWLDAARVAVLREAASHFPGITAAGYHQPGYAVDAVLAAYNVWRTQTEQHILPAVGIAFGESFNQQRKSAEYSNYRWEQAYLANVADRLRIWPEGAFEELRPELLEALSEAEDYDQIRDRVGRILNIDATTRALRARINFIENRLANPDTDPADLPGLNAKRRELYQRHDDSLGEWQWKARRIARTEAHGAIIGGKLAAARATEIATGDPMWKRWLATEDERVRLTHRVADGQIVKLAESFRVGGFLLAHPGDPITIAPHETINCRCTMLLYDRDELQDALQGPDGSMGEIRPGGVRIGPDDPDDADAAVAALAEETSRTAPPSRRGEDHGQTSPAPAEPVDLEPESQRELPALPDLALFSDDELTDALFNANDGGDDVLYDYLSTELDRRLARDFLDGGAEIDATPGGVTVRPTRATVDDYRERGQIAPDDDPDRYFTPDELAAAEWLRAQGYDVLSIDDRNGEFGRSADSVVANQMVVEMKAMAPAQASSNSAATIERLIRSAAQQSSIVVVDGRRANLTRTDAEQGLRDSARRRGNRFDRMIVVLNDDEWLSWRP